MTTIANPTTTEIREEIAYLTGFPLAAISQTASVTRFAIDRAVVDGERLQAGLAKMASALAADGVGLFHVRAKGPTNPDVAYGTWQQYKMRKLA